MFDDHGRLVVSLQATAALIDIVDVGGLITAAEVESALQEIFGDYQAGGVSRTLGGDLDANGNSINNLLSLGLTGGQIAFPAIQAPSANANTLDDYEEGNWTPTVGGSSTYSKQIGRYIKIGKLVYAVADMDLLLLGTGSTTIISGLPFTSANTTNMGGPVFYFANLAVNVLFISVYVPPNTATLTFVSAIVAGATAVASPAIFGDTARIMFHVCYEAAA